MDIALSFANGELGHVKFASFNNVVSACGYVAPKTDFVIAPFDTPLVDIILGELFLSANQATLSFGKHKACKFPTQDIWYDISLQHHGPSADISVLSLIHI